MKLTGTTSNAQRAFTLLELLIAVAIFAIVLAAMNTVFYAAMRLRNSTTNAIEAKLPFERAAAIIQRDLANLVVPGGTLAGQLKTGAATTSLGQADATEFFIASGLLDENLPWGEVQKVAYLLVNVADTTAGKDLVRAVSRNLLPVSAEDAPTQQWLMSGVQTMTFHYYDGSQWRDSWDSTVADLSTGVTNVLPRAIKVQIQFVPDTRTTAAKAPVELVVPVFAQTRTNQLAATSGGGQ